MAHLGCVVESCAYNKAEHCCLSSIEIGGNNADEPQATCCDSFAEKSEGFVNESQNPEIHLDIRCAAEKCVYNNNRICQAHHVDIAGISAGVPMETLCATFHSEY